MKPLQFATAIAAAAALATPAEAAKSQRITFENAGEQIVGELYLPDNHKAGQKLPAVVITGAWMTVRQQMPARYAREMADRGFAALIFDFRGWGDSAGERRSLRTHGPRSRTSLRRCAISRPVPKPTLRGSAGSVSAQARATW